MRTFIATAVLALLASLVMGAPRIEQVVLSSGLVLEAEVLEMQDDALVLRLPEFGNARLVVPLGGVSEYSLYELKRVRLESGSAAAHEALGNWARERELFAFAMSEYAEAIRLAGDDASDALRAKAAESDAQCGKDKLDRANALLEAGETRRARDYLRNLLREHPTCPAAEVARSKIAKIEAVIASEAKREREAVREATAAKDVAEAKRLIETRLERAAVLGELALLNAGSFGRAENYYVAEIEELERAMEIIEDVQTTVSSDESAGRDVAALRSQTVRRLVAAHVALGHNYVVKGNLVRARRQMGLALALDPNDPEALRLRAVISENASDRLGRTTTHGEGGR
jgi:Tfp pilus assembly protein PilF